MAETLETPLQTLREQLSPSTQPAFQPDPVKLDEAKVRAALMEAANAGIDPFKVTVGDMDQGLKSPEAQKAQAGLPVDVPEKFKKPNGEVDVEKLKASTERLDEAIQQKEAKVQEVQKSVDDYVRAYKEKENQFRTMPNPERLAAQLPPMMVPPVQVPPTQMTDQQLEAMIAQDLAANPARTVAQLVQLAIQKELQPLNQDRQDNRIRENIKLIAEKDPRILNQQVFDAVNAKLQQSPELWNLKNPHKAAWLEVKEEMRLGDLPQGSLAQPSKPSAPILGGGTPPPSPSLSDARTTFQTLDAAISQLSHDPRTGKISPDQQKALDQAAKEFFDAQERLRPR